MSVLAELADRGHRVAGTLSPGEAAATARYILDTVGCVVAGRGHPLAAGLVQTSAALRVGVTQPGRGLEPQDPRTRVGLAAIFAHLDEIDAFHTRAAVLPCATVVPVALELARHTAVTGPRLLAAVAAGADVIIEAGLRLQAPTLYARGWWPAALFGPLGAAMTASLLLGHDPATCAHALALAAAALGGLLSADELGAGHYRLLGRAAADGLDAALAADRGLRASLTLLDQPSAAALGKRALAPTAHPRPHLPDTAIKMYPCARPLHAALEALAELRERGTDLARAKKIRIRLPGQTLRFVTTETQPAGPAEAAASATWAVAAFLTGRATDPTFFRAAHDTVIADVPEVHLAADAQLDADYPARWGARVELVGPDLPPAVAAVDDARGGSRHPWTHAHIRAKFQDLVTPAWSREAATAWARQCTHLHHADARTVAAWAADAPLF